MVVGRKGEGKRERENGERWDIIRSARPTVDSTEIYWPLFLVRAKGGAELIGGGIRRGNYRRGRDEPLQIPSIIILIMPCFIARHYCLLLKF